MNSECLVRTEERNGQKKILRRDTCKRTKLEKSKHATKTSAAKCNTNL